MGTSLAPSHAGRGDTADPAGIAPPCNTDRWAVRTHSEHIRAPRWDRHTSPLAGLVALAGAARSPTAIIATGPALTIALTARGWGRAWRHKWQTAEDDAVPGEPREWLVRALEGGLRAAGTTCLSLPYL